jgi:hypothetical protein
MTPLRFTKEIMETIKKKFEILKDHEKLPKSLGRQEK